MSILDSFKIRVNSFIYFYIHAILDSFELCYYAILIRYYVKFDSNYVCFATMLNSIVPKHQYMRHTFKLQLCYYVKFDSTKTANR